MEQENKIQINDKINQLINRKKVGTKIKEALNQLEPETHEVVVNKRRRPDKPVKTDAGEGTVKVARIPIGLQGLIVKRAVAFLIGKAIKLKSSETNDKGINLLAMIQKTWDDNKLDFKSKELARTMMSELECAEIWYAEDVEPTYWGKLGTSSSKERMRMKIVSPSRGDDLYPEFNERGDLVSFGRRYFTIEEGKKIENFDLYTSERTIYTQKISGNWTTKENGDIVNELGKIPIIYYSQSKSEWSDVQRSIDRLEFLLSNFADTNDYFSSPIVLVEGGIKGFAKKGETGKVLELANGAKASYLTWDAAPEAIKLEIETLFDIIYTISQTPNISFKEMKGIGAVSGVALDTLMIDGQLKAQEKQEGHFGECIQRRNNLLRAFMVEINPTMKAEENLSIWAEFGLFKINNAKEEIENIARAKEAGFLSVETAVELNPLIGDAEQENKRITEERERSLDDEFND